MSSAAYVPPQGIPSLEAKLVANSNGAKFVPEWGEVRIVMRERDEFARALRQIVKDSGARGYYTAKNALAEIEGEAGLV